MLHLFDVGQHALSLVVGGDGCIAIADLATQLRASQFLAFISFMPVHRVVHVYMERGLCKVRGARTVIQYRVAAERGIMLTHHSRQDDNPTTMLEKKPCRGHGFALSMPICRMCALHGNLPRSMTALAPLSRAASSSCSAWHTA